MCGICGFTGALDNRDDVIKRMTEVITHRGPDSDGFFSDETIAMGFRRLSIIDLETGHQPIYNEDKTLVLTFNGEIYNYKQLREELTAKGHRFATESDSEVLVHGFEEWKEDLLPRLRGMFAFAVYNTEDKSVFIARDPFGIKPLHYTQIGNDFVYASEIKSILEHPKFEKRFNRRALDTYLSYQYALPPDTFFEEVYCLLPGHYLWYQNGAVETFRYFEPRFRPDNNMTEDEAVEKIEKVFEDSVNAHKIADVEVGCFLSSGVDSSYVSTYFSGQKTFTVGFDYGEKYNEISWAESLSKLIDVEHHTHLISGAEFWDAVPTVQYYMDQPLADPSCVALYFVSRLASQYVKVVLSGEGADELFGGYTCYNDPRVFKVYQTIVPHFLRKALRAVARKLPDIKGRDYVIRACDKLEDRYIGNAFMYDLKEKQKILKEPAIATAPQRYARKHYYRSRRYDDVTKMQYLDINLWLTGDILLKADRMSMANSLELRVPFLDKEVFKVASSLPTNLRVNKHNTKYALRKAAAKHMPESTAEKEKLGFPVPTRVWLREEKYYNIVRDRFESATAEKFFNTEALMEWLDRHFSGKEDNSRRIWTVYVFLVWYDIYFNENTPGAEKPANRLDELKAAAEAVRAGRVVPDAAEAAATEAPAEETTEETPAEETPAEKTPAEETADKAVLGLTPALGAAAAVGAVASGTADEITEDVFDEGIDDIEVDEEAANIDDNESWEAAFEAPLPEEAPEDSEEEMSADGDNTAETKPEEYYEDEEPEPEEYYEDEETEPEEYYEDEETEPEEYYEDQETEPEEHYEDEETEPGEYYEDGETEPEEYYEDEETEPEEYYEDEETEPEEYYEDEETEPEEYYEDEETEPEEYYEDEETEPGEYYEDGETEPEEYYEDETEPGEYYEDGETEPEEYYEDEETEPEEYYEDEETEPGEYYEDGETEPGEYYEDEETKPEEYYEDGETEPEEYYEDGETESGEYYDEEETEPGTYGGAYDESVEEYWDDTDDADSGEYWDEDAETTGAAESDDAYYDDTAYDDTIDAYEDDEAFDTESYDDTAGDEVAGEEAADTEPENTNWEQSYQTIEPEIIEENGEEFIDISVFGSGKVQLKPEPAPAPSRSVFDDIPFLSRFFNRKKRQTAAQEETPLNEAFEEEVFEEEAPETEPTEDAADSDPLNEAPAEEEFYDEETPVEEEFYDEEAPAEEELYDEEPVGEETPGEALTEENLAEEAAPEEEAEPLAEEETDDFAEDFAENEDALDIDEITDEASAASASPQEQMQMAIDSIEKRAKNLSEPNIMSDEAVSKIRFFGDDDA